jgi:hypothetical protein
MGMREVQWFLARYERDLMRAEAVNIGVILRAADDENLKFRFLLPSEANPRDPKVYRLWVTYWTKTIQKHGTKCIYWLPKRRDGENYYIVYGGSHLAKGEVNFEELFDRLCGDVNTDEELPEELKPGHWKKPE